MGSAGLEFDPVDSYSAARLNQKTTFVGTGTQIAALATTYAGQLAFATSTTGGFNIDTLYERNSANSAWAAIVYNEIAEANTTPVTDGADFVHVSGTRYYAFFTLPTTEKHYIITGIEWKNGATVSGNMICGIDLVDADPPTLASVPLVANGPVRGQTPINSIQRESRISSKLIRGGTILGAWVMGDDSVGTLREQTGLGSQNQSKAVGFSNGPPSNNVTAWATATARKYVKVYYRGYT